MPNHSSRLLPAPQSRPTDPRPAAGSVAAGTTGAGVAVGPGDALTIMRRLCPLADVLDALGADQPAYDAWVAAGTAWPLYVHPSGRVLVDPAAVLGMMADEAQA